MIDANKTYVGVVEDNKDPNKNGRVRVRVMDVFDQMKVEDIPWANPWKDLNGNQFNIPEEGKVVMVVFDDGNEENPEFIYSDHYNVNLENKLKSLSESDYKSMKSLIFDHKTQIYVNDSEGLKIDYKYNNLNILENSVNVNLKDNNANLNLGDSTASQQAILGNHFLDWFETFIDTLQVGGLFNAGGPTLPNPTLIAVIAEFKALKEFKYLSHHVNIVDNNKVSTVNGETREDDPQYGDKWTSTKDENTLTKKSDEEFVPKKGPNESYDKPVVVESGTQSNNIEGVSDNGVSENETSNNELVNQSGGSTQSQVLVSSSTSDTGSVVEKLISFLRSKNYKVYEEVGVLNLVGMRNKDNGVITNKFDESLYVFYMGKDSKWVLKTYDITTVPGLKEGSEFLPDNVNVLVYGQFVDQCKMGDDGNYPILEFENCVVFENTPNDKYNYSSPTKQGNYGLKIKKSSLYNNTEYVFEYSNDGSQVFKNFNQYTQFVKLCKAQVKTKNTFTYALCRKTEFDDFTF